MRLRAVGGQVALACLVAGLQASWTAPSRAQSVPGVLVVRAEPAESERARALSSRILDGALEDGRDLAPPPPPLERTAEDGWLGRAVLAADDQFARFDLPSAAGTLDEARGRLERDGAAGARTTELVELFLLASRVAQALGNGAGARDAVRRALAIDPTLIVDAERHPPTTSELVEAERASMRRCPVTFSLSPSDAVVSLDGRAPGPRQDTLPCGEHYVSASAPGYLEGNLHFSAGEAGERIALELRLDPGAALSLPSAPYAAASSLEQRAARSLGRDLVFLDVGRDGDAVVVVLGGRRVRAPSGATVDELLGLLRAAGLPGEPFDVGVAAGVSVGAALAVAAVITVIVAVLATPPPTGFELRGQILP